MTKTNKIILGSTVAASFMVLVAGGAVMAAQTTDSKSGFIDRVAQIVGVEPQKLQDGVKQASKEQIDAKLKDGKITQSQADEMKKKIDAGEGFGFGGPKGRHGGDMRGMFKPALEELTTFLGISKEELATQMKDGKSLVEIAKAKGKSEADVKSFLSTKFDEQLAKAVKDNTLTQAKADEIAKNKEDIISKGMNAQGFMGMGKMMGRPQKDFLK